MANSIRLNLVTPSSNNPGGNPDSENENELSQLRAKPNSHGNGKKKLQKSKTLSSMVDAFLAKENFMVNSPDGLIALMDLFIKIYHQSIDDFIDEFRIYYGQAWINKNAKGYSIRFCNSLRCGDLIVAPSFFIPNDIIDQQTYKNSVIKS